MTMRDLSILNMIEWLPPAKSGHLKGLSIVVAHLAIIATYPSIKLDPAQCAEV